MGSIIVIFVSLIITSLISAMFGFVGYWLDHSFWNVFVVTFGIQMVIGWLWNSWVDKLTRVRLLEVEAQNNLASSIQQTNINCAYCSAPNMVNLALNRSNDFTCSVCKQVNLVKISVSSVRTTSNVTEASALADMENKIKDLKEEI